jgi:hypothetical protein
MFLSNRAKYFLTLAFFLIFSSSCSWFGTSSNSNPSSISKVESDLPFPTKEPDKYVADIVVTAGDIQTTTRVARDGSRRRYDYDLGQSNQLTVLVGPRSVRMLPVKKLYTEDATSGMPLGSSDDPMTNRLLHEKQFAQFEELGTENNVTRYSCKFEDTDASKAIIYIDKTIGIPVRQDLYSIENGVENLVYSMEIRNFRTDVDPGLFDIPSDYRPVSAASFRTLLSQSNKKS